MKPLYYLLAGVTLSLGLLVTACNSGSDKASQEKLASQLGFNISLTSPLPPNDVPANADSTQLAAFAWNEFFALNWQSSYPKDNLRDHPDPTWNYSDSDAKLTVWETYAHRSELRPNDDHMQAFDLPPKYSYGVKPSASATTNLHLFDNLDENSEIGSCMVFKAQSAASQPDSQNIVLYQAKVNRAEYDYIRNNYPDTMKLRVARTITRSNILQDSAYYPDGQKQGTCYCPPGVICLPCGSDSTKQQGTIEVKTAWRRLAPGDTASHYLTRQAIYYMYSSDGARVVARNGTFALIALHIIHKTVNHPDFVFATFEHIGVRRPASGFRFQLLDSVSNKLPAYLVGQPHVPYANPIPQAALLSTVVAHAALAKKNPKSVLQYYQLAGVQGNLNATPNQFGFRLANYVVESDRTLAYFHGSGIDSAFNQKNNTLIAGKLLSAAGCQGCHGVAQQSGTDFSFLLTNFLPAPSPDIDIALDSAQAVALYLAQKATLDSLAAAKGSSPVAMTASRQRRGRRQLIFTSKLASLIRATTQPRQRAAAHTSGKK